MSEPVHEPGAPCAHLESCTIDTTTGMRECLACRHRWQPARPATLDTFTRAYLECALWTSDPKPRSGEWSERPEWCIDRIDDPSLLRAVEICREFQTEHRAILDEVSDTYHTDDARHGHDFWLTRNGHGAGFWGRGYDLVPNDDTRDLGEILTEASNGYGTADLFCSQEGIDSDCGQDPTFDEDADDPQRYIYISD
jgi:hypothetical protein